MKWVKFTKYFQGGVKTDYEYANDDDLDNEDHRQLLMENWGENSDGGHAYGYRVEMEILEDGKFPPKDWLERKIEIEKMELGYLRSAIRRTEELIKIYESQLKM
jgi:hypothetical protein